ncbi:MAG TPA: hypothetical protein PKE16_08215 [Hyphomicrobium sp.]|nr:hypothetical protein [Hyphomicrobium sp.]
MDQETAAEHIARGLNLIRAEAVRLDSARAEGRSFEATLALKTIKDECFHLRRVLQDLHDTGQHD